MSKLTRNLLRAASTTFPIRGLNVSTSRIVAAYSTGSTLEQRATPPTPRALGYLGAAPFLAGGLLSGLGLETATTLTQCYGAAILSFLGGTHWGLALPKSPPPRSLSQIDIDYVIAVTPSLLAAFAVAVPSHTGLPVLSVSFAGLWAVERIRWSSAKRTEVGVPRWYVGLRVPLTVAAVGATGVAALSARRSNQNKKLRDIERNQKSVAILTATDNSVETETTVPAVLGKDAGETVESSQVLQSQIQDPLVDDESNQGDTQVRNSDTADADIQKHSPTES